MTAEGIRDLDAVSSYDVENFRPDSLATVDFIVQAAGGRSVLEFGAGTGRLLLPLAEACESVVGVDISAEMISRLTRRALPANVEVHEGDMRSWRTQRRFSVVACLFNTLMEIPTQQGQVDAVVNAASMVAKDGVLVTENLHPPMDSMAAGQRVVPLEVRGVDFGLVTQLFDWKTQRINQRILSVHSAKAHTRRLSLRAIFPAELDLMAALGGLRLRARYASWRKGAWMADRNSPETANVISVYEKIPSS